MPTRLSRYADGIMEAAWLAAVIVVPLFFNVYSSRIFEPDKIAILRTIALVMLAGLLVRTFELGLGEREGDEPRWKTFLKTPIILPVLFLTGIYLISTIFSVIPEISLFGSYQRLQGTYSTLSYIVIFAGVAVALRQRAQIERLITTLVLVSLPISFYGMLQFNERDPVPWAGDVSRRIAANMGNAIFVAAYLIMVIPLTIGRLIQAYRDILDESRTNVMSPFLRATGYFIILLFQLVAVYLSRSRGPILGLIAGLFFLFFVIIIYSRIRWLTYVFIGLVGVFGLFLVLLNIQNGPLEPLRETAWVGRFGHIFDMEQGTNRVRTLIWEGAVDLVTPHEPLGYPDGTTDAFNVIRPLVGYGPESMHVAYNRFYPPELGQIENRNASPDRSHNETWDTLVTTGALGLAAYLVLFCTIFYYGLKWLGLLTSLRDRYLYLGLFFGGSVVSALGFYLTLGVEFLGVAIPFGAIVGLVIYLALWAILSPSEGYQTEDQKALNLTILILLAGLVGHFVEINFGIAIASTRTYFWVYTGMILAAGYYLPRAGEYQLTEAVEPSSDKQKKGARGRKRGGKHSTSVYTPRRISVISGGILALILGTLGYNYINAQGEITGILAMIWNSYTSLPNKGGAFSIFMLVLLVMVWLFSAVIFTAENSEGERTINWKGFGITLGVSLGAAFLFWVWHALGLLALARSSGQGVSILTQAALFERLLTRYYVFLILFLAALPFALVDAWPRNTTAHPRAGWAVATLAFVGALVLGFFSNLRVIQADITFKLSDPLARGGQYEPALELLERTSAFSYGLDHYSLYLGKSYLEYASLAPENSVVTERVRLAEASLEDAQDTNPLNTDHTANLARLYRWWAGRTTDEVRRQERAETASEFYDKALNLSPNNAALWGEWGSLYMTMLGDFDATYEKLSAGEAVDPEFDGIHALLGDYYTNLSRRLDNPADKEEALRNAVTHYREALSLLNPRAKKARLPRYNYRLALGVVYNELGEYSQAILVYEEALEDPPNNVEVWRVHEAISQLHAQLGDRAEAIRSANLALSLAPQDQRARLQEYIDGLSL